MTGSFASRSSPKDALPGLLELLYPLTTFLPNFTLRLDNLAGVARLAAALKAPAILRQCAAARDALGVVPAAWEAGYADERDPRYLLDWLKDADAIPGKTGRLDSIGCRICNFKRVNQAATACSSG